MRLLLVAGRQRLTTALTVALKEQNYTVDWLETSSSLLRALSAEHVDVLMLALSFSGNLALLQQLRRQYTLPVIVLANPSTPANRTALLNAGADDYLARPLCIAELHARINALSRRGTVHKTTKIHYKELVLDCDAHQLILRGVPVPLTHREFKILHALLMRQGQVVRHEQLQQVVYGWGKNIESNSIEVHVHQLRKKIGPALIQTVRSVGYRMAD